VGKNQCLNTVEDNKTNEKYQTLQTDDRPESAVNFFKGEGGSFDGR